MLQYYPVGSCNASAEGALLVNRPGTMGLIQRWAEVPHASTHTMGAGASVYEDSAHAASLQTPCRTAYDGRTLSKAFFTKSLYIYVQKHMFNSPQGVQ